MRLTESYLDKLYRTYEQEIRGDNKPIEDVDHRPNYIGMCINMMESPQMKISCLRKLKELTAMNPFYQHRVDRFIDAINDRYEPTEEPGFVEYIRGTKDSSLTEGINKYLNYINDQEGPPAKEIQLKSSGAEQDDEEPPTDERTKEFEKNEAKVDEGVRSDINEFDWGAAAADPYTAAGQVAWGGIKGAAKLAAANPKTSAALAGVGGAALLRKKLQKDKIQACHDRYEGYPDKIKRCLQGQS